MNRQISLATVLVVLLATSGWAAPQQEAAVRYVITFPDAKAHYIDVEMTIPVRQGTAFELMMPVWTPGSYLVREFARHVEGVSARAGGRALPAVKTLKNRWRIDPGGASSVTVRYRLYCREMTVDTNFVDSDMAVLNGAATFLTPVQRAGLVYDVMLDLPRGWKESKTALRAHPDGRPNHYRAPDYDTLADSPIVAGNPKVYSFTVGGKPHELVLLGEAFHYGEQAAKDVEAIVRENLRMWGFLPYERYLFLNVVGEAGGGLEHKESTLMMSRAFIRTRQAYIRWLGLASHEYFHTWNVKRLRPVPLGPFDYEHEVYTPDLWISEGFTSYYGIMTLHRAGVMTDEEFLESLSGVIEALQTSPGRLVLPLSESSFDAWIKHYRQNENTPNSAISYYTKGELVAFLLDARIRKLTGGRKSLDDVMKLAYSRYAGTRGFTPEEFRKAASEVAGSDLTGWFRRAVDTTEELDYGEALEMYGLRFQAKKDDPKDGPKKEPKGFLGASTRNDAGRLIVTRRDPRLVPSIRRRNAPASVSHGRCHPWCIGVPAVAHYNRSRDSTDASSSCSGTTCLWSERPADLHGEAAGVGSAPQADAAAAGAAQRQARTDQDGAAQAG